MLWAQRSDHGPCIGFDEHEAAALLVDHLASLGHLSVGFIGGATRDNERARRRFRGLVEALVRHGMTLSPAASVETEYGFREGFDAMNLILARRAPVTAIVCGNDYLAAGALSALHQAGIAVPGKLSIASFNDNDFAAYLHPALTTVRLPIAGIGIEAGRRLVEMLAGNPVAPSMTLPVELVVRSSTGPVRKG
jgi:LacI family transcriptional regulator